jgi:hypothetical protein
MHFLSLFAIISLAPIASLGAPASYDETLFKRENLCSLSAPPSLCQPDASVTVEETALRAYKFYRSFVLDGDPKTMFSLIDSVYKVSRIQSGNISKILQSNTLVAKQPRVFEWP